jgi:hypothetical protein
MLHRNQRIGEIAEVLAPQHLLERGVEDLEVGMRLRGDFADPIDFGRRFEVLLDQILGVVRRREDGCEDDEELENLLQNLDVRHVEILFDWLEADFVAMLGGDVEGVDNGICGALHWLVRSNFRVN